MRFDPLLLFQHLVVAANVLNDVVGVFKYELCSYPPALFEDHVLLRDPEKIVLADAIWTLVNTSSKYKEGYRVEHSFTVSLGYVAAHIWLSVHYVRRKYGNAIVVLMDMKDYQQKT